MLTGAELITEEHRSAVRCCVSKTHDKHDYPWKSSCYAHTPSDGLAKELGGKLEACTSKGPNYILANMTICQEAQLSQLGTAKTITIDKATFAL